MVYIYVYHVGAGVVASSERRLLQKRGTKNRPPPTTIRHALEPPRHCTRDPQKNEAHAEG